MPKFSVNLYEAAASMLAQRGDFTLEELLNFAFTKSFQNQNLLNNGG